MSVSRQKNALKTQNLRINNHNKPSSLINLIIKRGRSTEEALRIVLTEFLTKQMRGCLTSLRRVFAIKTNNLAKFDLQTTFRQPLLFLNMIICKYIFLMGMDCILNNKKYDTFIQYVRGNLAY